MPRRTKGDRSPETRRVGGVVHAPERPPSAPFGFESAYQGRPPWDIGKPQGEVVRLADAGEFVGKVLDIGCGTGENALELAGRGLRVWGVDGASNAIRQAKEKSAARGLAVSFSVGDAFDLSYLGTTFDSVLDCGLFHVFDDPARVAYVESLRRAVRPGGRCFVLAFSDAEPADWGGPRRVSEAELRAAFREGWVADFLRPARFQTMMPGVTGAAWCARFTRVPER